MDIFGFKSRKVYKLYELICMTFLMMLISCSWTQEIVPNFNVTCNSTGLFVKIAFSKPFDGIAYAKGHRFDPLCKLIKSSAMDGSLLLPLTACGTYVQDTNHPWVTNTVVVQQYPLVWTENDFEKSIICSLPPFENSTSSSLLLDQIYKSHPLTTTKSSSDTELELNVFHDDVGILDYTYTTLTISQLLNGTIYNDVGFRNCIADDKGILDKNGSALQMPNAQRCLTVNSENSSSVMIHYMEGDIIADVKIKFSEKEFSDHYLRCEVFFCKKNCSCSEIDKQMEYQSSIIGHKLMKRSADTSEIFTLKQYQARTRYLKSTVKALMDNIMKQRKENDNKSKIKKRVMRLDDSTLLSETNYLGSHTNITPSEIFSSEPVTTEFYNIEPHLIDIYEEPEIVPNLKDFYDDDSDFHHDYEEAVSTTTEDSTLPSDKIVVTLPKESEDNSTKVVPDEELQEKGLAVFSEEEVLSVDSTTENIKTATTSISVLPPPAEDSNDHLGNCVPRLRFLIVTIGLGFFIGCLLLITCGMVLYIRKEKKRNRLNDFLLYSIGF